MLELDRLVAEFELEKLSPSPAIFDLAKLDWLDHEHIMALAPEEHERRFAERLPAGTPPQAAAALAAAFQPSLVRYGEAPAAGGGGARAAASAGGTARRRLAAAAQLAHVRELRAGGAGLARARRRPRPPRRLPRLGQGGGIGARDLLMPLRIALTSAEHGPELPFVLAALDRDDRSRRDSTITLAGILCR